MKKAVDTIPQKAVAAGLNEAGFETLEMTIEPTLNDTRVHAPVVMAASQQQQLNMVDDTDKVTGYCTREECHSGEGIQHRAFSIFIFD
jgi:hypothetical protein